MPRIVANALRHDNYTKVPLAGMSIKTFPNLHLQELPGIDYRIKIATALNGG